MSGKFERAKGVRPSNSLIGLKNKMAATAPVAPIQEAREHKGCNCCKVLADVRDALADVEGETVTDAIRNLRSRPQVGADEIERALRDALRRPSGSPRLHMSSHSEIDEYLIAAVASLRPLLEGKQV